MSDASGRVAALSGDRLRRLMARLSERQGTAAEIPRVPRSGPLPLSFAQERLWFLEQLGAGGAAYHIPAAVRLRGPLDGAALERTLAALVERHEALRTTFGEEDGRPVQIVHSAQTAARLALPRVDLSALPDAWRESELARISRQETSRPFDLAAGPLLRAVLVRLHPEAETEEHLLALTFHHIVTDGWSLGVLVREVAALYPGIAAGNPVVLPELPIQPADYAVWERERLRGEALESELSFWRERLAGLPPLELPADRPRSTSPRVRGGLAALDLSAETAGALEALAQRERATPFMALLALFQVLLLRSTGQSDFGVGTPVANRTRSEVEGLIGLFVNTVVLRVDQSGEAPGGPSGGLGFAELLRRTREVTLAAFAHQGLPFEKLVEELRPEREAGRNPLFQVLFTLQNQPLPKLRLGEIDLELSEVETGTARADLTLVWREREGGLAGTLEYSADLFEPASAERLLRHLAELLRGALAEPESGVWDLPLLTGAERAQILGKWRGSALPALPETTVHALFAEQAAAAGDRVAVETEEARLTYAELESRANQLAWHLRRLGVGPDCLVGLAVPRSPEMVVGLLGILKAGGAYLPLDPATPRERLDALTDMARPRALVTLEPLLGRLPGGSGGIATVCLDRDRAALEAESRSAPVSGTTADNLVYVLYTSGSTGQPKGVAVPHRGVVRLVRGADCARLDADQVFLQLAPLAFDASTLEIWGPLANGGRLALAPPGTPSLADLGRALKRHGVTTLWLTAGLFHQMVDEGIDDLAGLRQLLAGGDVLSVPHVRRALAALPGCDLINGYGPTENTTFTCCHRIAPDAFSKNSVPIGRPIANTRVDLLDRELRPVPVGVPGELYTGGDGLARGYLGRPDLTAERFVPSPLAGAQDAPGSRLYRTGDLARWRPDGAIEFLGRLDQQVKIRGFRIEPGEIEAALATHPEVAECAVVVPGGSGEERRLIAWLVPRQDTVLEPARLRAWLADRLPAYMVPAAFAVLEALPLTPNGKVDRRALARRPLPTAEARGAEPETPLEHRIAALWSDLLGQTRSESVRIGRDDDFFALGGHSLLATRVVSRLRADLGLELPLATLFENPTLAGLALAIERDGRAADAADTGPIPAAPGSAEAPLSFAQERLWFLAQLRPGGATYNIPAAVRLAGRLDPAVLAAGFGEVVRRHSTLRTTFPAVDGEPRQRIVPTVGLRLPLVDLSALPDAIRSREARHLNTEEAAAPFDLTAGPLLRATLLRLEAEEHLLLLTLHHIVADGWSVGILVREIAALTAAFAAGRPSPLPELPIQYTDFALWQRRRLDGPALDDALRFWGESLRGAPPELALPTDRPRSTTGSERGTSHRLRLSAERTAGVRALARDAGATPFMVLLAAFETLLSRLSGQTDLTVGTPVAGRQRAEVEGLIGLFVNTLVLRADLADDPAFSAFLARTRGTALDAFAHQDLPFEKLVEHLQPRRDLGHTPLFQAFFVLQNAPAEPLRLPGLAVELLPGEDETAKFDLTLALGEQGDELVGELSGSADLFDAATLERWAGHLEQLLAAAARNPAHRVSELPLLAEAERRTILQEWSATGHVLPSDTGLHRLVEQAAHRTPEAVAVTRDHTSLTYRELNRRANRLAHHLRRLGVGPEVRVGICAERSPDLIVGLLAILKAGGAYVPLDPDYPAERLAWILDDSRVPVLLLQESLRSRLPEHEARIVLLDPSSEEGDGGNLPGPVAPESLAYVIYTSGSTGRPKGVAIPHAAPVILCRWAWEVFGADALRGVLASTSVCFDLSVFEIFVPLSCGGRVVLVDNALALPGAPAAGEVTLINTVPSALAELLRLGAVPASAATLNLAGEPLPRALARRAQALPSVRRLFNLYGPSEDTTYSTFAEVPEEGGAPSIGRPIANTRAYVLDRHLEPVPAGVPGQLFLGGGGLARGYLGQPAASAEKFVPDPFGPDPGARLYATGDLVRWSPDGALDFLGRIDRQVKIRGFRIEPGEIEAALLALPEIRQAAVEVREIAGSRALVAYVAGEEPLPTAAGLREILRRHLPEHMVPAFFVPLAALPLTPNGKLDRKALPMPEGQSTEEGHQAPRTPVEELLAGIWTEVLGLERIGIHQSFFELGGHSLLATRVVTRLPGVFGVELPVRALFERPTVAELGAALEEARRGGVERAVPPLVPVPRAGRLPLSFAQQRLWFIDQLSPGSPLYNIPVALRLTGPLDPGVLALTLETIVGRHEALRTVFALHAGTPSQLIQPAAPFVLPLVDLSGLPEHRREPLALALAGEEAGRPFDLARGPLLRGLLLRSAPPGGEMEHVLALTMHHIASDGWSMGILIHEVTVLYPALSESPEGRPSPLPELAVQYGDFAAWQRSWLQGAVLEEEIAFWRRQLAGLPPLLELPTDRPRPAVQSFRGASRSVRLPLDLTRRMEALGRREGATLFMVLLAGFQALLARYSGQQDLAVGTPIAGRNRMEIEGLIGFFVNTLVLRGDLTGETGGPSFGESLRRVRETALTAYRHQDVPFERLVQELAPERNLAHTPLFQVMLSLQNTPSRPLELPGLTVGLLPVETGGARFDLTLALHEGAEGGLAGSLEYNAGLFDAATVERLVDHLLRLCGAAATDPDLRLAALPLLSPQERHQLLVEGGSLSPRRQGEASRGLHHLFEEQAERRPEAVALVYRGQSMSYRDLDHDANRLAHLLIDRGVGPEVRVGLCLERSLEMVVAILAVLKAGGAYVPLDPALPGERLLFQLEDAGVAALVTRGPSRAKVSGWEGPLLSLDEPDGGSATLGDGPATRPAGSVSKTARTATIGGDSLAYVLYTSGSTGRPKGVAVTHSNVMRLLEVTREPFGFGPHDTWTLFHSYAFDFSVWELWGALALGGRVVVVPQDVTRSPEDFFRLLRAEGVTVLNQTPSAFRQLAPVWAAAAAGGESDSEPPVRWIIFGGEALEPSSLSSWFERRGPLPRLVNMYGITETTVHVTLRPVRAEDTAGAARSLIGGPLSDLELYVTDRELHPQPLGIPGELCVGGEGLARGYWRRPELTAARFVPDPWSGRPGARLYRSGDLGRKLPDGDIESLGRIDHQVKIRGLRIELGEIEATLARHPAVRASVVQAVDRPGVAGDRRLAAWVAMVPGAAAGVAELRAFLGERLADYMIPASFVLMDALPLTPNGKVDRAALPALEGARPELEVSFVAPRTREERAVAAAWQEVLGVERVGVYDNFFDLGGHSLLMVQVQSRLRDAFAREVPVLDLFQHPTVGALARHLSAGAAETSEPASFVASESRGESRRARASEQQLQRQRRRTGRTGDFEP